MTIEPTEFGGSGGLIQPPPHQLNARETSMVERMVSPDDPVDSPEAVLADILAGKYPRQPLPEEVVVGPLQPDVIRVGEQLTTEGFGFVGVGNSDLRTARLKVSSSVGMYPATYGPEKEINPSVAPAVVLEVGSLAPGHYYYQVLMNNVQVTQVWEVDVV